MLEQLLEWPAHGHDQTVQKFDNSTVYLGEGLFQHDLAYASAFHQRALSSSPKLISRSTQSLTLETQDTAAQWSCVSHTPAQHPTIHRPVPRYPPGYNHEIDHPPLVGGHMTSDVSTTDPTPTLTDLQSEPLCLPVTEGFFTYIPKALQHENTLKGAHPSPESQTPCFSTHFQPGTPSEDTPALRNVQGSQAWDHGYHQPSSLHVSEHPTSVTHVVPLKFSRERYNALLQICGPAPLEIKIPSSRDRHSFAALDRRGCHPVISISETGEELSDITVDLNGIITMLTKDNFCRVPGCGYWSKNAGRVPRHRLTHFTDRGFECQNPFRKGANVPKPLQCHLGPGQYLTRLDLFKKHCRAQSCQQYAPSFAQDSLRDSWRGPDNVDELCLLPFTRDVHIPFILMTHKS